MVGIVLLTAACSAPAFDPSRATALSGKHQVVHARIIATGIPGAGAICQVADFHAGSPIHDQPAKAVFTLPGAVLDPRRLLVASSSNFGAPLARPSEAPGTILSLDASGSDPYEVPADFATAGGQASALGGRVQVYTAQSPAFRNGVNNPGAATAALMAASLPTSISLNSGNGRPWLANAPSGADGDGTITVLDPTGVPLAGAPFPVAGGVFSGNLTNRNAQTTHGLTGASLSTAIFTKSPDGTGRAVFASAQADGSVEQVHVGKGVDALAAPGTFTPVTAMSTDIAESADPGIFTRMGMVFNWVPTRNLILTDSQANRVLVLDIGDNGTLFTVTATHEITARELDEPVDIAPATREVAGHNFSSNTTLGGGSDMYVLNRGNNSVVRMTLAGEVVAIHSIEADVPGFRVNGIAVSWDGQTLWVTATAPGRQGVVLAMPTFGDAAGTRAQMRRVLGAGATTPTTIGAGLFSLEAQIEDGLGPLFNAQACGDCHESPFPGGMGTQPDEAEFLQARIRNDGRFDPLHGHGGITSRIHSISELGSDCDLEARISPLANVLSLRNAMTLRGNGLIDTIVERDVRIRQAAEPAAVRGRINRLADGRMGKFGWKADVATLVEFMGQAYLTEIGLTNPLRPVDEAPACGANAHSPEIDGLLLQAVATFLNTLDPPVPTAACLTSPGATLFQTVGCADCHAPSLPGRGTQIRLFSDLLLHDMGPGLADQFVQGSSTGNEFRTMPLWRNSERSKFLHDGRAATVSDAVSAHGGQAAAARDAFQALDAASRQALLDFLGCI